MPQVQLSDQVFNVARRRAAEAGFANVDDYIADVLVNESSETRNLDYLFTPERLAELERISAKIDAGEKTYLATEVWEHLERKRKEWLEKRAS